MRSGPWSASATTSFVGELDSTQNGLVDQTVLNSPNICRTQAAPSYTVYAYGHTGKGMATEQSGSPTRWRCPVGLSVKANISGKLEVWCLVIGLPASLLPSALSVTFLAGMTYFFLRQIHG